MTLAVVLLTCGRLDYTRTTLETFSAQNPAAREQFLLLHADDGSEDPRILALAQAHGFETVVAFPTRRGARTARAAAIQIAADRGCDWVLLLENDWEWVRPFPWPLLTWLATAHPEIYTVRLYGRFKSRHHRQPCFTYDLARGRQPVTWRTLAGAPEATESTRIHWGQPPAVTRMVEMLILQKEPPRPGYDARGDTQPEVVSSGRINADVARVLENVVYHIGDQRTPALGPVPPRRSLAPWQSPRRVGDPPIRHAVARPVRRAVPPPIRRARSATRPPLYTPAWQETRHWTDQGAEQCLDLAWHELGMPGSLLDVGCGTGHLVTRALARGIDALGVDLSRAETTGPFRHADLRAPMAWLRRFFDLVLCWEVAEHLPPESADTLCDSLVRHLAPGGVLLFTAARPGQGGDGHLNEQPAEYWRDRLVARGLEYDVPTSAALARDWMRQAPRTPWYGKNLQVFLAPGRSATFTPMTVAPLPRVAITMRTADRAPKPNYVGGTIQRLLAQGLDPSTIHLCATAPEIAWLRRELPGAPVTLHVPDRPLSPNENGLAQIRAVAADACDWVLLLEDDLAFCRDFLGSVQRWLLRHARADRHVYRLFGFRLAPPRSQRIEAYDWTLRNLCGSQAVLLRAAEAQDFLAWGEANLLTWGGFRGNARIAFDKLLASWAQSRWPGVPGVMSHPLFVQHVGDVSSLHPRAARNDALFAGATWRYQEAAS